MEQVEFSNAELRRMERIENMSLALGIVGLTVIVYGPVIVEWFKGVF